MIKAIRLQDCTPYNQAELSDCKKVNFIFGANGSGKSTVSSFLAKVPDHRFDHCAVVNIPASETHPSAVQTHLSAQ